MGKCKEIKITIKGNPKKVLDDVKKLAAKNDIVITGNEVKGSMKHKKVDVKGTYTVKGQEVTIKMEENSWIVSCDQVNKGVKDFFKGK